MHVAPEMEIEEAETVPDAAVAERVLQLDRGFLHRVGESAERELLAAGGFSVREIELVPRPTPLKTGMEGWLRTCGRSFFDQFPEPDRTTVVGEVMDLLRPSLCDRRGVWTADHIRLRFHAERGA